MVPWVLVYKKSIILIDYLTQNNASITTYNNILIRLYHYFDKNQLLCRAKLPIFSINPLFTENGNFREKTKKKRQSSERKLSFLFGWLLRNRYSLQTRAKRQKKKLNLERELRPGSACVKTSPMIKTHRGALLSTLYTRL